MVEVILDGSAYILQNLFDGKEIQRAAEIVMPCCGSEEWLMGEQEMSMHEDEEAEPLSPRHRRAPRRYTKEC